MAKMPRDGAKSPEPPDSMRQCKMTMRIEKSRKADLKKSAPTDDGGFLQAHQPPASLLANGRTAAQNELLLVSMVPKLDFAAPIRLGCLPRLPCLPRAYA